MDRRLAELLRAHVDVLLLLCEQFRLLAMVEEVPHGDADDSVLDQHTRADSVCRAASCIDTVRRQRAELGRLGIRQRLVLRTLSDVLQPHIHRQKEISKQTRIKN